jgi:N-acetylglucosamine-6-phosphate deacetylase
VACIHNARVILEDQVLQPGWVSFESGFIAGIGQSAPIQTDEDIDARGLYLSPGFIDLHIHGGRGFDFLDATPEGFADAASFHLTGGTTSLCPTAATATYERFESVISRWQQAQSLPVAGSYRYTWRGRIWLGGKRGRKIPA